jgi:dihydrofolate reductase
MAKNRTIGRDNALPWKLPDEMNHFVRMTRGKPVIMGRKQFESMPQPLPGRTNIVLTRDATWSAAGAQVVHTLDEALAAARRAAARSNVDGARGERREPLDEVMVIGGGEIYALALPVADRLYMTVIDAEIDGDVHFPPFDEREWTEVSREDHAADARHPYAFSIRVLDRGRERVK